MKKTIKRKKSDVPRIVAMINSAMKGDVIGLATDQRFQMERIPTGSLTLDRITGGGFPRGRHVELFGDYMAGKSTSAYRCMALAQQRGEVCAVIDAEKTFDEAWFRQLDGDPDELIYYRPKTGEELIQILMLFASKELEVPVSIVLVDSVASLLPSEELSKDPTEGDDRTASRARLMSRMLRRVTTVNDKILFLWTNHTIDKISGYGGVTTPGGRALKFYASIRIEMKKLDRVKKPRKVVTKGKIGTKEVPVGQWVGIRAEKQKTARPEMESMFLFDIERQCIDREYEILHLGMEDGLITRSGNTFSYVDDNGEVFSGTETRFKKMLAEDEELAQELVDLIEEGTILKSQPVGEEEEDGEN